MMENCGNVKLYRIEEIWVYSFSFPAYSYIKINLIKKAQKKHI